jgi:ribonucleotide monophosphatase NagD (HAD superfamily)
MNVGKPDPTMLETIVGRIGLGVADCVMTGDRLYTEIRMALDADMVSALIMTGKTTAEKLAVTGLRARQDRPPDTGSAVGGGGLE